MASGPAGPAASVAGLLHRVFDGVAAILRASLVVAAAVMLGCIALQVVMRYLFRVTPSWSEEVAILMFAWITLGGLALGVREAFHVRLTLLIEPLPAGLRSLTERAIALLTAALGAYFCWSGIRFVDFTRGSVSAAVGYPIELLHGMAPVSGFLLCLFALERLIDPPAPKVEPLAP